MFIAVRFLFSMIAITLSKLLCSADYLPNIKEEIQSDQRPPSPLINATNPHWSPESKLNFQERRSSRDAKESPRSPDYPSLRRQLTPYESLKNGLRRHQSLDGTGRPQFFRGFVDSTHLTSTHLTSSHAPPFGKQTSSVYDGYWHKQDPFVDISNRFLPAVKLLSSHRLGDYGRGSIKSSLEPRHEQVNV